MKVRITEYLDMDLEKELWFCNRCQKELGSARQNYKTFLRVRQRDPGEVHPPCLPEPFSLSPNPETCQILEFLCPQCFVLVEVEYLPPGHPITHDIELDIDSLKARRMKRTD